VDDLAQLVGGVAKERGARLRAWTKAQDCGPEELAVLRAALAADVRVVAVADLDQAIFKFRRATPEAVSQFGDEIGRGTRLSGNIRSSPAIVRVGELLRSSDELDEAIRPEASNEREVAVFPFEDDAEVAGIVRGHLAEAGIAFSQSVVLAHRADDAASCAGADSARVLSRRAVMVSADAALTIATDDDPFRRRRKLADVERSLLRAAGVETGRTIDEDLEQLGMSTRWIREAAMRVVCGSDPRTGDRSDYTAAVRQIVQALPWPHGTVVTNQRLGTPPESDWSALGMDVPSGAPPLPWMIIHGAKGREFDAVTLVIPRAVRADEAGLTCLDHWEHGSDGESRRVLYVGATRAIKHLMIAVHKDHYERVLTLLA
jgi:DNA helicase II / ATP-dependent DNA helicase PcrA